MAAAKAREHFAGGSIELEDGRQLRVGACVRAPPVVAQTWPSGPMSTPAVDPHVLPSGNWPSSHQRLDSEFRGGVPLAGSTTIRLRERPACRQCDDDNAARSASSSDLKRDMAASYKKTSSAALSSRFKITSPHGGDGG